MLAVQISLPEWHYNHHHHPHHRRLSNSLSSSSVSSSPPILSPKSRSRRRITTATSPYSSSPTSSSPPAQLSVHQNPSVNDDIYSSKDIEIEIDTIGKNSRRIRSRIAIDASLGTVWRILTNYERLAEFIPGLAVSRLLEKTESYARLFQIGQQKLAFGINFNAKGIVDCYEKDLEILPFGERRDIEFRMIEGDFQLFEGRWSIEQYNVEESEGSNFTRVEEFSTTLSYVVDVEPKLWLPVRLVEGRLCNEIKINLSCIRAEAQKYNMKPQTNT